MKTSWAKKSFVGTNNQEKHNVSKSNPRTRRVLLLSWEETYFVEDLIPGTQKKSLVKGEIFPKPLEPLGLEFFGDPYSMLIPNRYA